MPGTNRYLGTQYRPTNNNNWWVENIKMDLREIEWDVMDWIDLAQDRD
jgi:hypothetical protein